MLSIGKVVPAPSTTDPATPSGGSPSSDDEEDIVYPTTYINNVQQSVKVVSLNTADVPSGSSIYVANGDTAIVWANNDPTAPATIANLYQVGVCSSDSGCTYDISIAHTSYDSDGNLVSSPADQDLIAQIYTKSPLASGTTLSLSPDVDVGSEGTLTVTSSILSPDDPYQLALDSYYIEAASEALAETQIYEESTIPSTALTYADDEQALASATASQQLLSPSTNYADDELSYDEQQALDDQITMLQQQPIIENFLIVDDSPVQIPLQSSSETAAEQQAIAANPSILQTSSETAAEEQQLGEPALQQQSLSTQQELGLAATGYGLLLNCAFGKASSCLMAVPGAAFQVASLYYAFTNNGASLLNAALTSLQIGPETIAIINQLIPYLPYLNAMISILEGSTKVQVPFPTTYFNTAYNITPPVITVTNSIPYNFSPIGSVYNNNTAEAPSYLTCPATASPPHPTTDLYFYANKGTPVAGDHCTSKNTTFTSALYGLTTDITVPPIDEWLHILFEAFNGGYITNVTQLYISNPGVLTLQDIGYFPSVDGQLSNGWNTSSYIFDAVPSTVQHSIWSWNLVLANLSNAHLPKSSHLYFQLITVTEPGLSRTPPFHPVLCLYTGPYFEQTTLDSVNINYLPFTETLQNYTPVNYNPQPNATFDTEVYPYLLYNYLLSENNSQLANPNLTGMTEDIYSPWNYYNPANAEDQFPLDLPSVLFANSTIHEGDLITLPQNGIGLDVQAVQTLVPANLTSSFSYPPSSNITDPISIASTENNYVFVLYYNANTSSDNIAVIRLYPHGTYNPTVPLPSSSVTCGGDGSWAVSDCGASWDSEWGNYWNAVINEDNNTAYVVDTIPVPSNILDSSTPIPFNPYNIATDNGGDIFASGGTNGGASTILVKIENVINSNGDVCLYDESCDQFYWGNLSGIPGKFTEITESPILGTVDLANPTSGAIEVFNGENLTYIKTLSLTFDNSTALSGIPEPFSQQANVIVLSGDLNITKWLTYVGLFGIKNLAPNPNSYVPDQEAYHHPLAISDVNGYTYVLDDWSGNAGGNDFNILMLRVLSNGTSIDVPVNPSLLNDVSILTPREKAIIDFDSQGLQFDYPPYGVILSANVSGVNFCSSTTCEHSQSNINGTYYPIGPELNQSFAYVQNSFSNPINIGFSMSTDGQMATLIPRGSNFKYGELLFMNLNPVNYTNTISGLPTHKCYLLSATSLTCDAYNIGGITPPIYATGDMFKYLENLGSQSALSYTVQYNSQFATSNTPNSGLNQTCIGQLSNFSSPTKCPTASLNKTTPYTYNITSSLQTSALTQSQTSNMASTLNLYSILQSVTQTLKDHLNIITEQPFLGDAIKFLNSTSLFNTQSANTTKLLENQISLVNNQGTILVNESELLTKQESSSGAINSSLQTLESLATSNNSAAMSSSLQTLESQEETNNTKAMSETLQTLEALGVANNSAAMDDTLQTLKNLTTANDTAALNETKIYFNQLLIYDVERDIEIQELGVISTNNTTLTSSENSNSSKINPPVTKLTTAISGQAIVAYEYKYDTFQWWGPFITTTPQYNCPIFGFLPPVFNDPTYKTYAYALTPFTLSDVLPSVVQGGPTYLLSTNSQTNSSYYLPTLADTSLYLSQHILFNLTTDRSFGRVYVANSSIRSNNYEILNATQQDKYIIQTVHIGNTLTYQAIESNAIGPNYDAKYSDTGIQATNVPSSFLYNQTLLTSPFITNYVTPTEYTTALYSDRLYLYLPELLGYQRIVYAFTDDFNNTIYAPLDVDIVKITSLLLNATPVVNVTNSNKTTLFITGRTGEYSYNGFFPNLNGSATFIPLPNASVYLYYNHNINYVGLNTTQDQLCTFGNPAYPYNTTPFPSNCTLANPNYIGKTQNAGNINYNTQYNSSGFCAPSPNSLLGSTINCNIYGEDNHSTLITALCPTGANNNPSYCIPLYLNGSGTCTTQLGLISIVKTNSTGGFNLKVDACGTGEHDIIGQYYGDSEQPAIADQNALNQSADSLSRKLEELNQNAGDPKFQVLNYHWSPNVSYSPSFQTGSFVLSFGVVSALQLVLTIATIVALFLIFNHHRSKRRPGSRRDQLAKTSHKKGHK